MLRPLLLSCGALTLLACASAPQPERREALVTTASQGAPVDAPDGAIRAVPMPSAPLDVSKPLSRIVFASCAHQNEDQSMWTEVAGEAPDLTLFIGDNVYGDVRSGDPALPELKAAYMRLAKSAPFAALRAAAPMLTVWDDHDYGLNDAGAEFEHREAAQALFNYVWATPENDPRRAREGVYNAWTIGEDGKRVQIILLDTRFFRSALTPTDERGARGAERYVPSEDPDQAMLGDAQWAWLEEELKKPADLRLLVSSIQVLAEGHGWEAWRTMPRERQRLYDLIERTGAEKLIVLSGDRHAAALYARDDVIGYPLLEATSSSVNLPQSAWRAESGETYVEPGPHRTSDMIYDANYGVIDVDWDAGSVRLAIKGAAGEVLATRDVSFETLSR